MKITATAFELTVNFKIAGKLYGQGSSELGTSVAPFDTAVIPQDMSYEFPEGSEIISVRELGQGTPYVFEETKGGE